jgi:hypothetical protein
MNSLLRIAGNPLRWAMRADSVLGVLERLFVMRGAAIAVVGLIWAAIGGDPLRYLGVALLIAWALFGIIWLLGRIQMRRKTSALLLEGDEMIAAFESWNPTKSTRPGDHIESLFTYQWKVSRHLMRINPERALEIATNHDQIRGWAEHSSWPMRAATFVRAEQRKLGRQFGYDY